MPLWAKEDFDVTAESDLFYENEALMTMVQWKSGCDYYLLSYEHFYLPNLPLRANGDCDVTETYL